MFMFFGSLTFLCSVIRSNEKEYIEFRENTYVLLYNLNEMFDIADDTLIENLDVKEINNSLMET